MNKQISLKAKLVLILFCSLLVLTSLSIIMNYITIVNYNKLLTNEITTNTEISAKSIDDVVSQLNYTSETLATNKTVQNYLANRNSPSITAADYTALNNCINDIYFSRRYESCSEYIDIVSDSFTTGTYLQALSKISQNDYNLLLETSSKAKGNLSFFVTNGFNPKLLAARSILQINNLSLKNLGTIIIGVDINKIMKKVSTLSTLDNTIQLLHSEDGKLIYQSSEGFEKFSVSNLNISDNIRYDNKQYIKVTTRISSTGWHYTALVSAEHIVQVRRLCLMLSVFVSATALILLLCISRNLIKEIFKGFDELVVYIRGGKVGFDISDSAKKTISTNKELDVIYNQVNDMADKINDLIYDNYQIQLLANDFEIKALSAQINPHFLYNTLDTVNWKAKSSNNKFISEMVESLGKILHKTLSNPSYFFSIKDELFIVEHFLTIQKIRYQSSIHFESKIDNLLLNCLIPRLILQPIVENSIQEAMRNIDPHCSIHLDISTKDNKLFISVSNTGSSFEDDFIEKFYANSLELHGFGIGLKNIEQRLRLCYKENFSLQFHNNNNQAIVEMELPIQRKGD